MESISDDEVFAVDSILAQRKRKGVIEYLVSWKGAAEDTWEPAKTIATDCAQLVQSFLQTQKTQKSSRSKSRSKSRSRSSSRSRKATPTRKSSRSRSRGRTSKNNSATTTPAQDKEETITVRRSVRHQKAAAASSPDTKEEKKEEEVKVIETTIITQQTASATSSNSSMAVKSQEPPQRTLRSSTMEQREKLEVQRVHNEQRPIREDDAKPRSPIWRVADYIVIVLFIVSLCAAIFLFLEKFFNLEDFKKQAFPNLDVLRKRLAGAHVRVVELGHSVGGYVSDVWLQVVDFITLPKTGGQSQDKAVPK